MAIATSVAAEAAANVPVTATVTQSGADAKITIMAITFGGEMTQGEPVTGTVDENCDLQVTGNGSAIPTIQETACGTTRASRLRVSFRDAMHGCGDG